MKYAVVDAAGNVVNVVEWDGVTPWEPPEGTTAVPDPSGQVGPGWTYENGVFVAPPAPPLPSHVIFNPEFDKGKLMYEILTS